MRSKKVGPWLGRIMALAVVVAPATVLAQAAEHMRGGQMMDCMPGRMGGGWMGGGMIFAWLFGLSLIAALVALTIYLVRHSRPTKLA